MSSALEIDEITATDKYIDNAVRHGIQHDMNRQLAPTEDIRRSKMDCIAIIPQQSGRFGINLEPVR
jgi:hypothetical protein